MDFCTLQDTGRLSKSLYSSVYKNENYLQKISFLKSSSFLLFYGKGSRICRFSASFSIHALNLSLIVTNTCFTLQPKRLLLFTVLLSKISPAIPWSSNVLYFFFLGERLKSPLKIMPEDIFFPNTI